MMLVLTEEQKMLQEMAAGFLSTSAGVEQLRKLRDEENADGFDRATWAEMAEMGWAGVLVPEEDGGVGLGYVEAGVIAEEMGRNLTASPFLSSAVMAATALNKFGSTAQKSWLGKIAAGEALMALAVDEGRKHAPTTIATTAERRGNGFVLNGAKTFVAEAQTADALIVSARTSGAEDAEEGATLFLVPTDADGVDIEAMKTVDSRAFGRIDLRHVELDADAVLGEVDEGAEVLKTILQAGRAAVAAEMLGSAQESFERAVDYAKERTQFGVSIASFQALQHRAADLYADIQMAKSLVLKALKALDGDSNDAETLVTAAKVKTSAVAQKAAQEGIQFHGGVGMTDAVDIGLFMKRVRVAEAFLGDGAYHAEQFAKMRGY
ncbi:MAG: acyl-CoA dehydrogenase family protein [Pseudomonadota bacterium]